MELSSVYIFTTEEDFSKMNRSVVVVGVGGGGFRIHLKHQVLFSLKTKKKYLLMTSAAVVIDALRVKNSK